MSRTNIDIDDALIAQALRQSGLKTKREVVDFALRRLVSSVPTTEDIMSLRGIGWDEDLTDLRNGNDPEHKWR